MKHKHLSFHSFSLPFTPFHFLILTTIFLFSFLPVRAQQIQSGDRFWDGSVIYDAQVYNDGSVELTGKDINYNDYNIILVWMSEKGEYSVYSRNGAIALRINEGDGVKRFIRKGSRDFLVFYNAKGDAAWTMEFFINGEVGDFTLMERKLEQRPASEVTTSEVLNTTWLARFPKEDLRLMRNEILARHGWRFQSKDLQDHFKKQKWYKPVKDNSTIKLSDVERTNLEMITTEEATPDEYRYSMLSPDMFPDGLADDGRGPEEIDGVLTYTVTNEREFLNALGPNRTIIIDKNVHLNLSRVLENETFFTNNTNRRWAESGADFIGQVPMVISESETDGQQLDLVNIDNLTLRGAGNSSIEVNPRYSYCLYFINCKNCRVENLTIGHSEYGYCSGGVIGVTRGENINVRNCDLYGCGTYGFDVLDTRNLDVRYCFVHDCTYGIMMLRNSTSIHFTECDFYRNKEYDLVEGFNCNDVIFDGCLFYSNSGNQVLFNFNSPFTLQGCEIYHPTEKLGTMNMADQSGKKNFFSSEPDPDPIHLKDRTIGPNVTFERHAPSYDFPMFLYTMNKDYMMMVYWSDIEEPKKSPETADYFEAEHARWELQESFRRNADQYINMITPSGKICILKYLGETLKDPKGNPMYPGELHSRPSIPSPGLKYAFAYPGNALPDDEMWGVWIVVTNNYLRSHAFVPMRTDYSSPMPDDIVKKLEKEYHMEAERSVLSASSDRHSYGIVQFKGPWKTRIGEYGDTTQVALALEVFTIDGKVYSYPMEGYYDPSGPTWNADDDGQYFPGSVMVFEGPDGPEFCHLHGAPESITASLFTIRNGKLEMKRYEVYHTLYDEPDPDWDE